MCDKVKRSRPAQALINVVEWKYVLWPVSSVGLECGANNAKVADVWTMKVKKVMGPDRISSRLLKSCVCDRYSI